MYGLKRGGLKIWDYILVTQYVQHIDILSDFTTDPTTDSTNSSVTISLVTDSPVTDSTNSSSTDQKTASVVIGVLVALGIVLSVAGIALFYWAHIIRAKKLEHNRRVSVQSTVNQLEEPCYYTIEAAMSVEDTRPEVAISSNSEAPMDVSHEAVIPEATMDETAATEGVCPIMTSSNPAYGCVMEKVNEDHAYMIVNLLT